MVRSSAFKHTIRSSTTVAASSRQPIAPSTPSQSARRSPSQRGLLTAARSSQPFHSVQRHAYATESIPAPDIVELYAQRVARGELERDEQQLRAVYELRKVQRSLIDYTPSARLVHLLNTMKSAKSSSASSMPSLTLPDWLSRREMQEVDEMSDRQRRKAIVHVLKGEEELLNLQTPTGFMLTGPPGTGKSLLLDLFFESMPTPHKSRRHYHHFLLSLYHQVFADLNRRGAELDAEEAMMQLKSTEGGGAGYPWSRREEAKAQAITKGWRSVFAGGLSPTDPTLQKDFVLANIARDMLLNDGWLLAFDEVQLVDVAGASILRRVLEHFWRLGGVVVGTSNRLPDDLYQKGIQREQFLTFLAILQSRCPVTELRSPQDYRRIKDTANLALETPHRAWYLPSDRDAFETAASEAFGGQQGETAVLTVYGRPIEVPRTANKAARFDFADLCSKALGPADYISIASRFHTIIIDNTPVLPLLMRNEARRFITLIDSLYETKTRLICLAAAKPDALFFPDAATATAPPPIRPEENDEADMSAQGGIHPLSALRMYEDDAELAATKATQAELDTRQDDSLTSEMMTEVLADLETPYRPNIASYSTTSTPSPSYDRSSGVRISQPEMVRMAAQSIDTIPAFRNLAVFSGEDERFAYARAVSRLYEMGSASYARGAPHMPLAESARSWERPVVRSSLPAKPAPTLTTTTTSERIEVEVELTDEDREKLERIRRRGVKIDPLKETADPASLEPPKISASHAWGIVENWGIKAGRWGRGAQAYADDEAEAKGRGGKGGR